jgi:hypothetical protein
MQDDELRQVAKCAFSAARPRTSSSRFAIARLLFAPHFRLFGHSAAGHPEVMLKVLVEDAIRNRFSLTAHYEDYVRFFSPHALGADSSGATVVIAYQYGGGRRGGLPPSGDWACFYIGGLSNLERNADRWIGASRGAKPVHVLKRIDIAA